MGNEHTVHLHVRISRECQEHFKRIAGLEDTAHAELVRRVLWRFVRAYDSTGQLGPLTKQMSGTQQAPFRLRTG
jgi:hypothetical protein